MVVSNLTIGFRHPSKAPEVIEFFDREFIHGRGRSITFARRFSDIFSLTDSMVVTGSVGGELAAALLVRPFTWRDEIRDRRGAMIGLVCTLPPFRRAGYAHRLLEVAEARCCALGLDFGVLWARQDGLYVTHGWVSADCGVLGLYRGARAVAAPPPIDALMVERVEALHEKREGGHVSRHLSNYSHLLPPSENMCALVEGSSFALCGWRGETGYVHDFAAQEKDMPRLWSALTARFASLYVNVERHGAVHRWLAANSSLAWTEQSLAMWKPFRKQTLQFARWHVPFLDRI